MSGNKKNTSRSLTDTVLSAKGAATLCAAAAFAVAGGFGVAHYNAEEVTFTVESIATKEGGSDCTPRVTTDYDWRMPSLDNYSPLEVAQEAFCVIETDQGSFQVGGLTEFFNHDELEVGETYTARAVYGPDMFTGKLAYAPRRVR